MDAVAHDVSSASHAAGAYSVSQTSFTWNHAGGGSARAVLIFVIEGPSASTSVTSVTYGDTTVPAVTGGSAADTANEPGRVTAFFLDNCGTGTKAVVVNRTSNTQRMWAAAITVTCAGPVIPAAITLRQENAQYDNAERNVDDGTLGVNSLRCAACYSGATTPPTIGGNSTEILRNQFGAAYSGAACRETTAGEGSRPVGFAGANDDWAAVYLALRTAAVGVSKALDYKVVTTVGRSCALPYQVDRTVGSSRALPYKLTAQVGRSCALPYGIVETVGLSTALAYKLTTIVGRSDALAYTVAGTAAPGQIARPNADQARGSWDTRPTPGGALYSVLDETTEDVGDWIESTESPVEADVCEVKLTSLTDPASSVNHFLRVGYEKAIDGGDTVDLTVRLVQGTSVVASRTFTNVGTHTVQTITLTGEEADAITDYSDLRVRLEAVKA